MKSYLSLLMAGLLIFAVGCQQTQAPAEDTTEAEVMEEEAALPESQSAEVTNMVLVNPPAEEDVVLSSEE